jgi:TRAP transporter 4TM/12TM fusion protein
VTARAIRALVTALGVAFVLFHMTLTQYSFMGTVQVQNIHLGISLILIGLVTTEAARSRAWRGYGLVLAALGLFVMLYVALRYETLINAQGFPKPVDVAVGILILALVFETTRLRWEPAMPILGLICVAYYVFGHHLPASWGAPYTPFPTVISNLSIGLYSGIFGQFMAISANDVFLFMVFGGLLASLDASRSFNELGKYISRKLPGGSGLTTVVSSGLMGTVTGTAVSNVAICGSYTIPMMKRDGYPPHIAAAIEATASTGGQLAPPVLGSAAFIMAALLAVSYVQIAITAIIPSALYYVAVFAAVYFMSRRLGIGRQAVTIDPVHLLYYLPLFVVPLVVMTILLIGLRSVAYAAFYSILTLIGMRLAMVFVGRHLRGDWRRSLYPQAVPTLGAELADFGRKVIEGLRDGALQGAAIAVVIGTSGVMAEAMTATGAAVPIGWAVDALSGDSLFISLVLTAAMCVILGAGLPTVGAYLLTAAIAAPIVIENGVDAYTAHFFILYYACLSAVTPPVAAAVLPATVIAQADYWRTGWEATILSVMLYLLPFLFVYEPALLARNMPGFVPMALLLVEVTVISVLVAAASQGFLLRSLGWMERVVLAAAALAGMAHVARAGTAYLALACLLAALAIGWQVAKLRRERTLSATSASP